MKAKFWLIAILIAVLLTGCSIVSGSKTFRNTSWGMDMEKVMTSESSDADLINKKTKFKRFSVDPKPNELVYTSTLFDLPVIVTYNFNKGKLVAAQYSADDQYYSYTQDELKELSDHIKEKLTKKYGKPEIIGNEKSLIWESKKTSITMWDEPETGFIQLFYSSQQYLDEVNKQQEKYENEKFTLSATTLISRLNL